MKFLNLSDKWGIQICEKKIGCKIFSYYGHPSQAKEINFGGSFPVSLYMVRINNTVSKT